jgi:hypothetical protein
MVTKTREELVAGLVSERCWQLRNLIREYEALSEPVPAGRWRWADVESDGYRRKSAERLAEDRARARVRLAEVQEELRILEQGIA